MGLMGKPPLGLKQPKERGSATEKRFYAFMHSDFITCCLTGQPGPDTAHTGGVEHGKAMGMKAPLATCLPLIRPLHIEEERSRKTFWPRVGFDGDSRFDYSYRLYDLFEKLDQYRNQPILQRAQQIGAEVIALLADMQARANRAEIYDMLRNGK